MNFFFRFFTVIGLMLMMNVSFAQNNEGVSIAGSVTPPDPSAMLDVTSTTKGMLIPRMTSIEKLAISSPALGLLVFQTDETSGFYFWNGTAWQCMSCCSSVDEPWKVIGSTDVLTTGIQVPAFASFCFSQTPTPSAGNQKLSIRKLANGKVQIRGEFLMDCDLANQSAYLLNPSSWPIGYVPSSSSATVVSQPLVDGIYYVGLEALVPSGGLAISIPTAVYGSGVPSHGTAGARIVFIDIEYIAAP